MERLSIVQVRQLATLLNKKLNFDFTVGHRYDYWAVESKNTSKVHITGTARDCYNYLIGFYDALEELKYI